MAWEFCFGPSAVHHACISKVPELLVMRILISPSQGKNSACLCKTLMRGAASLMIGHELFIAQRKNIRSLQVRRGMLIKVLCVEDWPCALTVESRHQSLMSRGARPGGHPTKESCRRPDRHNRPEQSYHVPPTPSHPTSRTVTMCQHLVSSCIASSEAWENHIRKGSVVHLSCQSRPDPAKEFRGLFLWTVQLIFIEWGSQNCLFLNHEFLLLNHNLVLCHNLDFF